MKARAWARRAGVVLLVSTSPCADGGGVTGPPPDVSGSWVLVRTLVSADGCDVFIDPSPIEIAIRNAEDALEVDVPVPSVGIIDLVGTIDSDGGFEIRREIDDPPFSNETIVVVGSFRGDSFTAVESSAVVFLDPFLIELFGSEHCDTVIGWEGERA